MLMWHSHDMLAIPTAALGVLVATALRNSGIIKIIGVSTETAREGWSTMTGGKWGRY